MTLARPRPEEKPVVIESQTVPSPALFRLRDACYKSAAVSGVMAAHHGLPRHPHLAFPPRIQTRVPRPLSTPVRVLVSGAQPGFIVHFPH